MIEEASNKKILLSEELADSSIPLITSLSILSAAAYITTPYELYASTAIAASLYFIGLYPGLKHPVPVTALSLAIAGGFTGFQNFIYTLVFFSGFMGLYFLLEDFSEGTGLLVAANIPHLGDAVTTYIGVGRGLDEVNPFADFFIGLGDWTIFILKAAVPVLTVYAYVKFEDLERSIFLRAVMVIGLYIFFRNFFLIQS